MNQSSISGLKSPSSLAQLRQQIQSFQPSNEQESRDQTIMLRAIDTFPDDVLLRDNELCHFAASCWITNPAHDKVLMAYHNIYQTWAWTGGHADGDADLLRVALKEAREETSLKSLKILTPKIFSLEIIPVSFHQKRGHFIPSHLHLDCCFLFEADESAEIHNKPDENSGVRWFPLDEAIIARKEPIMREIYTKLNQKLASFPIDD